jgi:Putative lactococcus lactis phage r1t holin
MSRNNLVDIAERAGWTFVQAFAAALTLGSFTDIGALKLAAIAGGFSVVKFLGVKANSYLAVPPAK